MYQIAICITTFLRDKLLYKTLQSIVDFYPDNCIILVADQGYSSEEKTTTMEYFKSQINMEYYTIPFDSGLSYARNFLVQKAKDMNIPYCLISADSLQFIQKYDFGPYIDTLINMPDVGIIGFEDLGAKCPWEYNMIIDSKGIHLINSTDEFVRNSIKYKQVDICRNIFLGKTEVLLNLWDNNLKLCEHEDSFITLKKRGYKVLWTDFIKVKRINNSNNSEYMTYRNRFKDYMKLLKQKLGIQGWVIYDKSRK
jgi:hypothetical protein